MSVSKNNNLEDSNFSSNMEDLVITPFSVRSKGAIDYTRIIKKFGCQPLNSTLIQKLRFYIPENEQLHHLIRRNIYFAHRDLDLALDDPSGIFLYTGRGPSDSTMHIGHSIPFILNRYLQKKLKVPLLIMLSDDEKYFTKDYSFEEISKFTIENAKDILAFDFDFQRTFMFSNTSYMGEMYPTVCKISKNFKTNLLQQVFGFDKDTNVGLMHYTAIQSAACFPSSFSKVLPNSPLPFSTNNEERKEVSGRRCLIPCAIDQDPYFRVCRDVASKLKEKKPCSIYSKFLPSLEGKFGKMSSSENNSISLLDNEETLKLKIKKFMFSGAPKTMEDLKKYGANVESDVGCEYLKFFMENDEKYEGIVDDYGKGRVGTMFVKNELVKVLGKFLEEYKSRREKISDREVEEYMKIRRLSL